MNRNCNSLIEGPYVASRNVFDNIDSLEPASTATATIIGVSTFVIAIPTVIKILRNKIFRTSRFFWLFAHFFVMDVVLFICNLVCLRVSLQPFANEFYFWMNYAGLSTPIGVVYMATMKTSSVGSLCLSLNRCIAVYTSHSNEAKYDNIVFALSLALYWTVFGIESAFLTIKRVRFTCWLTTRGIRLFTYTNIANPIDQAWLAWGNAVLIGSVLGNIALNIAIIARIRKIQVTGNSFERGILPATVAIGVGHAIFGIVQIIVQYRSWSDFLLAIAAVAMKLTAITIDLLAVLPFWLLMIFSSGVRRAVLPSALSGSSSSSSGGGRSPAPRNFTSTHNAPSTTRVVSIGGGR